MDIEIGISIMFIFHKNIFLILFQPVTNVKSILHYRALQKETMEQIWFMGWSLGKSLKPSFHCLESTWLNGGGNTSAFLCLRCDHT